MNYLTNVKNVIKLSQQELQSTNKTSWHDQYKDSAWIFIGGLPYDLTEGDIICIFSQYGEVVNINLIRAKDTGKSKGFCFLCYEDQRSTILAVDNLNGIKIISRTIRVDHVQDYKVPKDDKKANDETKKLFAEGCAPKAVSVVPKKDPTDLNLRETLADQIEGGLKLPARLPIYTDIKGEQISDTEIEQPVKKEKKKKSKKKKLEKKSKKFKSESSTDETSDKIRSKKTTQSSEERDRRNRNSGRDKFNKKYPCDNSKTYSDPVSNQFKNTCSSSKTSNHSQRDSDQKVKSYRDISPSIPKRWR